MFGYDLGERRFQTLAMRGDAEGRGDRAGRIDADDGRFGAGRDRHAGSNGDARADAGQFRITRDADTDPMAGGAPLFLLRAQMIVADRGASGVQAFLKARFVPDDAGSDFVGQLVGADEVSQPDLLGVDPHLRRRQIHQPFHDEGRNRPADAAVRAGRRLRGRHRLHAAAVVRNAIGAGKKADYLHGLERRGPRINRVGADVADNIRAQR